MENAQNITLGITQIPLQWIQMDMFYTGGEIQAGQWNVTISTWTTGDFLFTHPCNFKTKTLI